MSDVKNVGLLGGRVSRVSSVECTVEKGLVTCTVAWRKHQTR